MYPADRKYSKDHEWIIITGAEGKVGVTDYAQKALGDIVFLELPEVGRTVKAGDVLGSIESVKAVSDLYAPMSGTVTAVNAALAEKPETVNKDPHGSWMVVMKLANPAEEQALLNHEQYAGVAV
jgi:glycine cleavage system H protein